MDVVPEVMLSKACRNCGLTKVLGEFALNRRGLLGRASFCKACFAAKYTKHTPARRAAKREAMKRFIDKLRAAGKPIGAKYCPAKNQVKYAKHRDQILARSAVKYAIGAGKMPRAAECICKWCGNAAAHYHHHRGYSKQHRLDVEPLCTACHGLTRRIDGGCEHQFSTSK